MNHLVLSALATLSLFSCTVSVKTMYDKDADFNKYKTFCWMQGCDFKFKGPSYLKDSLVRERIRKAIIEELATKGITQNNDNPDLLVAFNVTVSDGETIIYHQSEERPDISPIAEHIHAIPYLKGTLVLGIADKSKSKLVWESVAVRYTDVNPDLSEKKIREGIHTVLKKFPPKKK